MKSPLTSRRALLQYAVLSSFFFSTRAFGFDLFKALEPFVKPEELEKAKQVTQGLMNISQSSGEMDYKTEFTIGESLAIEGLRRYGLPLSSSKLQQYVSTIGRAVARNSLRPDIPYYFVVVDSNVQNAFACPGGIIFISSALMKLMNNESELACVLAHEIAHVSHKHAIDSIQRSKFFQGIGQIGAGTGTLKGKDAQNFHNAVGMLQDILFETGLEKNMEYEADISAMTFAYKSGYDPLGMTRILKLLKTKEMTSQKKGSWFATHPPLTERIARCNDKTLEFPDASQMETGKQRYLEKKIYL